MTPLGPRSTGCPGPLSSSPPARHRRHEAPDTAADFVEMGALPPGPARQRLQDRVVTAWLPMAHRLAGRYRNRGEALEDLEQVAALALVKAVEGYDPARGNSFEAYAIPTIMGELKRHFRDNMWEVHVPRHVQNLRNTIRASLRELETSGPSPTTARLAAHSGLTEEQVLEGIEALECFSAISLDAPLTTRGGDRLSLADTLGKEETAYGHVVDREAAKVYLARLPERQRRILYLRFFHHQTQTAIGEQLGLSQMHISRLLTDAYRTVREGVQADSTTVA